MSTPANQRKLDVVEELAQLAEKSGLTVIELALAWAINHPAVTSAIIGTELWSLPLMADHDAVMPAYEFDSPFWS